MDTLNTLEVDPNFSYPEKWTYDEYLCACGLKIRVGAEVILGSAPGECQPCAAGEYQHGFHDSVHVLPGRVFAVWELRDKDWIRTFPR
jgi:hypothetical protein